MIATRDVDRVIRADDAKKAQARRRPGMVDLALDALGLSRAVVLRTSHFRTVLPLVAASDLICTLPARIAHATAAHHGLAVLEPPIEIPAFEVAMFWHPRRERDPAARWLRERMRAAAAALRDPAVPAP